MSKDIVVTTALQHRGVLVSRISRLHPNIQLDDNDLNYLADRAPAALREAKVTIDDIY